MDSIIEAARVLARYELVYGDLFGRGHAYAFPCDVKGNVDIDLLSDRARNNYFYARAVVGNALAYPVVQEAPRPEEPGRDHGERRRMH